MTGTGFRLNGSVGPVETTLASAAGFQATPGLMKIYYYPRSVTNVQLSTGAPTELLMEWDAPGAEVTETRPASSYILKYSTAPFTDQLVFAAAPLTFPTGIPLAPGNPEAVTLNGLSANTTYYMAVESQDGDRGQSYLSNPAVSCTMANAPDGLQIVAFGATSIRVGWNTQNQDPADAVRFDAMVAENPGFTVGVQNNPVFSNSTTQESYLFQSLTAGTLYHFQVRAYNHAGVPTDWSVSISTEIQVGLPGALPFTGIGVNTITANWDDGGTPQPNATYQSEMSPNPTFSAGTVTQLPDPRAAAFSATYNSLSANTTYHFRVRSFSQSGQPSQYADLGSAMSGVNRSGSGSVGNVYVSSAEFSWAAAVGNGPNPFYYRLDVSPVSDFSSGTQSLTVGDAQLNATLTSLTANTTYYARLETLNGLQIPPSLGSPLFLGSFVTKPALPANGAVQFVDDYRIQVGWDHNGNNPLTSQYELEAYYDPGFTSLAASALTARGATSHMFQTPLELLANTSYYLQIRTRGDSGFNSGYVTVGSTMTRPTAPTAASYPAITDTGITVQWQPGSSNAVNGAGTMYQVDLRDSVGALLATNQTNTLSTAFGSLTPNTTYQFDVTALAAGTWPNAGPLQAAIATLAAVPSAAAPAFSGVSSETITALWGAGANPAGTRYLVETTSHTTGDFAAFISASAQGTALNQTFSGLIPNTSYYFRVWGVNHNGLISASSLTIGTTVTLAVQPDIAGFSASSNSITVNIASNGNSAGTRYRVEDTLTGYFNDTVVGTTFVHTPLGVNTEHRYRVLAYNRGGSPTAFSAESSTWTHAATPLPLIAGSNAPIFINWTLNPGANPTAAPSDTQFAIQCVLSDPDGLPTQQNLYLRTRESSNVFLLDGVAADSGIWKTFTEWNSNNSGVIVSSGLATGRTYRLVVYARNGNAGTGPNIPTAPSGWSQGLTRSGTPVLSLGSITGLQSVLGSVPDNFVWVSSTVIPLVSRGAFHNHFDLSPVQFTGLMPGNHDTYPGWNGRVDVSSPTHLSITAPDNNSPMSGFEVSSEGQWYVHVVGDGYYPGITNTHFSEVFAGQTPFRVFVDTTAPVVPNLRAQYSPTDATPIFDNQLTYDGTPYFLWDDPDPTPSPSSPDYFRRSPTLGYSFSYSDDPSVMPMLSSDTVVNSGNSGGAILRGWLAGANNRSVNFTTLQTTGTYYFKVASLDRAGNWSPSPAAFTYVTQPDLNPPQVISVGFSPNLWLPNGLMAVAVSSTSDIVVTFNDQMNPTFLQFSLTMINDNTGALQSQSVGFSRTLDDPARPTVATLRPSLPLQPGCRYELRTLPTVQDLGGNPLVTPLRRRFYTLMDPSQPNTVLSDDDPADPSTTVTFQPGSWTGGYAGMAMNEDPANAPMSAPGLAGAIGKADAGAARRYGGFGRRFVTREFNLYDTAAAPMTGDFNRLVRVVMRYPDADNNGILDGTENTPAPVRESVLAISWLDEDTGVWVRIPGSIVDPVNNTITADVRHFSVYGILGTPGLDLAQAYAYPVPYKPALHPNGIRFSNLSQQGTIKIYTVNGELVKTLGIPDGAGVVVWNPVASDDGSPVASDVYLYVIENAEQKKVGKLLIVR